MILYWNTKVKVRSPDGDTDYFDIVAGVLQGDTLAPYLLIICLDDVSGWLWLFSGYGLSSTICNRMVFIWKEGKGGKWSKDV